ncbi:MAG TPA: hypothetical protein VJR06_07065, partial [Nitrososphaerales archaeon]|nr:hypothetical protein [Nitrososphaerales archaeon]
VYAILTPSGPLGKPVGSTQKMNVTVFNVGTLPASSVVVAGQSISGLAAKIGGASGGTQTVTVTQTAGGLAGANVTRSYVVAYQDPSGNSLQTTTNVVSDIFSQTSMTIGFPTLTVGVSLSPLSPTTTNLTLSFAAADFGLKNVTSFSASGTLPSGLGCGSVRGTGITCSGGSLAISYPVINQSTTLRSFMTYNLTSQASYILLPLNFQCASGGQNLTGRSNLAAVPAGMQFTKAFSPAQLFGGMASNVVATAMNSGNLPFYNVTVATTADSFDRLTTATALTQASAKLAPGGNVSIAYPVSMSQTYGNLSATPVSAAMYFGGTSFTLHGVRSTVRIYQPLTVSIVTSPSTPEEGKAFTITFEINNPSGVTVS